ncbi:MAG: SDR family oxidoreductase [Kiritimatiellae bacterium]|nr:SDR family oxidoreductase [Kiritimatiellia bacterium]
MKTVLVTGGTKRIGAAIAKGLRERGWRVVTSSHRKDAGADVTCDFAADPFAADKVYEEASRLAGGRLDAIVNNAAVYAGDSGIDALSGVNMEAPRRLMALAEANGGSVVNILDTRVLGEAGAEMSAYEMTKAALLLLTREYATRSRPDFRVNAVAPGPVLAPENVHEKAGRLLAAKPTPEDVAAAVAFLLETASVTGAVVPVDGGRHLL